MLGIVFGTFPQATHRNVAQRLHTGVFNHFRIITSTTPDETAGHDVLSQYWELTAKVLPPNSHSILVMFKTVT